MPDCVIETEALVHLWQYDWPGNVRELESVIERVVVLCPRGVVRSTDLPASIRTGAGARGPSCRNASPADRRRRPAAPLDVLNTTDDADHSIRVIRGSASDQPRRRRTRCTSASTIAPSSADPKLVM